MNAEISAEQRVLQRLAELSQEDTVSPYLCLFARSAFLLKSARSDGALVTLPLQGRKRACEGGDWVTVLPGQMLVLPNARSMDVEHTPAPATGSYTAVVIPFPPEVLNAARQLLGEQAPARDSSIACVTIGSHAAGLLAWCDALQAGDATRIRYALVGVVLGLYAQGHHGLLKPGEPTLATRIRAMVSAAPARHWASPDFELALNMSGATLRRRLSSEGQALREILIEARLSHALTLLQSTRLPVKAIAARAGYASVSSFVKRFSTRYGVEPSRVSAV